MAVNIEAVAAMSRELEASIAEQDERLRAFRAAFDEMYTSGLAVLATLIEEQRKLSLLVRGAMTSMPSAIEEWTAERHKQAESN